LDRSGFISLKSRTTGQYHALLISAAHTTPAKAAASAGGDIADLKNEKHVPMSPKDRMTVEKVSLAMLAVLGVVGLAFFIATTLEVLPIISAS